MSIEVLVETEEKSDKTADPEELLALSKWKA